jgi:small subunit ribosomal protein S1
MSTESERKQGTDDDFGSMLEASFGYEYTPPRRGEIRNATILQIEEREIIVDLGAKQDGIVPHTDIERMDEEFRHTLKVGETVPVYVLNPSDTNNNLIVSINMGLQRYDWEKARELLQSEEPVDVTVTGYNKGGLLVRWRRLEGFIPSSHLTSTDLAMERRDAMAAMMNTALGVKVIEVDQDRRRLIFTRSPTRMAHEAKSASAGRIEGSRYCHRDSDWLTRFRRIRQHWWGRRPHPCERIGLASR